MEQKIVRLELEREICPYPLIIALKQYEGDKKSFDSGEKSLEIITDCIPATGNIPSEFKKKGFEVSSEKIEAGKWKIIIKK